MTETARTTNCAQCGRDLGEVPVGQLCPACGSDSRSIAITLSSVMTVASVGSPALVVGYENPRSWWEQWAAVGHYLSELRGAYQPEASIPNDEMKRRADQFFIACWHMCDWLINDATLPEVTEQLVEAFIEEHHPLQVCRAYANTAKHLELRKPERLRARVIRFHHSPVGRQLDVEYWSSTQPARTVDALELAEQSIAAWTTLLDHHGLTPPG